jgi:hypothetical protein
MNPLTQAGIGSCQRVMRKVTSTMRVFRDALEGVIQRLDPNQGIALILPYRRMRIQHVPGIRQTRIVQLQHGARIDDGAVLDAQRLSDRLKKGLFR